MNITIHNSKNSAENAISINQQLSHFSDKREGLLWIYLLSIADDDCRVDCSINTMALQLNMHRQTLVRFINRLCEKGYATWEITAGTRQPNLLHVKTCVTEVVTEDVTENVTEVVTEDVTVPTNHNKTISLIESDRYKNSKNPSVTANVTANVTTFVTTKEEKKQKKEEFPPAPPKEEKKQKKEKNTHTTAHACEKNPAEKLEERRQRFLATLTPYHERYGQEMVTQFGDYWTEPNRSMTKMRFELQRTWNTPLRLATWARNDKIFTQNHNNHDKTSRPTAAECIADAQRTAIEETERFIREAEIRRGGIPPHLPL